MTEIRVASNLDQAAEIMGDFAKRQLPFVAAAALTWTAADVREAEMKQTAARMKIRSAFVAKGWRSTFAKKSDWPNLTAAVGHKDWYMADQEHGNSERKPVKTAHKAIPITAIHEGERDARGRLRPGMRPKTLLGKKQRSKFFVQNDTIFERLSRERKRVVYNLRPSVKIRPVLRGFEVFERVFTARYPFHLSIAVEASLRTSRESLGRTGSRAKSRREFATVRDQLREAAARQGL